MFRRTIIFLFLLTAGWLMADDGAARAGSDSIRVSLLTCSPGQEVYALYGHTAIRCQTPSADIVFNYGVFDMSRPHFVWNFILGRTDYMAASAPWEYFFPEYAERGSTITEQELNLTQGEAGRLLSRLAENCLPENRTYRYNFLYNNCTTQVRDVIEDVILGRVQYPDTMPRLTARQILHHYTGLQPWTQEGVDLLLGSEVDTILSERAAMFIPENLMKAADGAFILNGKGEQRPLVKSKTDVVQGHDANLSAPQPASLSEVTEAPQQKLRNLWEKVRTGSLTSVEKVMGGALALCLIILLLEVRTKRHFWLLDVLFLLMQGTAGTLLCFMFLFSKHPAVGSNWQIWLLNPVAFVGIPLVIKAATRRQPTLWHDFYFTVLALFLLFSPWIPQDFAKITVPLALCLLTRPVSYYLAKGKKAQKTKRRKSKTAKSES